MNVAGEQVRTLRHGMAGAPGLEIWGPYESYEQIRDDILEAGREFGLEPVGSRAYSTQHPRVGLDPLAAAGDLHQRGAAGLPRVAARRQLRGHQRPRRQLRLGLHRGLLPQPVGARLRHLREVRPRLHRPRRARGDRQGQPAPQGHPGVELRGPRHAARLAGLDEAPSYQFFDLPNANYGSSNFDAVLDADGNVVGLSLFTGYSANERKGLSLATVNPDVPLGAEVQGRLGRARRRQQEDHRAAARAVRGAGHRQPGPLRRDGSRGVPPGVADRAEGLRPAPGHGRPVPRERP